MCGVCVCVRVCGVGEEGGEGGGRGGWVCVWRGEGGVVWVMPAFGQTAFGQNRIWPELVFQSVDRIWPTRIGPILVF